MTECEHVRADAPGLAALPPRDPERLAAWAHAAGCAECARALREAERLQAVLGEWHAAPVPAAALERAARAIEVELRRESRRRTAWSIATAAAAVLGLVAVSRHRGGSPLDWALAAALAVAAVTVVALAGRIPRLALAGGVAAALVAAAVAGGPGPVELGAGAECLASELGAAAVVVGAAWLALRGGSGDLTRRALAATAAGGALAGDAALQVSCASHEIGVHLLAFHVGGVILASAAAALLWRSRRTLSPA